MRVLPNVRVLLTSLIAVCVLLVFLSPFTSLPGTALRAWRIAKLVFLRISASAAMMGRLVLRGPAPWHPVLPPARFGHHARNALCSLLC